MNRPKVIITAGFAMFTMFFGSGNLVFPILMGTKTLSEYSWATIGILLTGVLVPFLGLIGIILYQGDRKQFFRTIGRKPAFCLTFFMLALLGPFGVVPRCTLVAYGSIETYLPGSSSLIIFALIFFTLCYFIVWKHELIVPLLGRMLTPLLILGIITIIISGLLNPTPILESHLSGQEALTSGILQGYQMMDLLAAFFFSVATVSYLKSKTDCQKDLVKLGLQASLIGGAMLSLVYIGFVKLGAMYQPAIGHLHKEQLLAAIAQQCLGNFAMPIASVTIILACLTTAAVLALQFAEFFKHDVLKDKIGRPAAILITLVISFGICLIGFDRLTAILGSILEIAYPAIIILTITNIINYFSDKSFSRIAFWLTLAICSFLKFAAV